MGKNKSKGNFLSFLLTFHHPQQCLKITQKVITIFPPKIHRGFSWCYFDQFLCQHSTETVHLFLAWKYKWDIFLVNFKDYVICIPFLKGINWLLSLENIFCQILRNEDLVAMFFLLFLVVAFAFLPKCLFKEEVWKVWPKRVVEIIVSTRKELASNAGQHNANFGLGWRQ